MTFNKADVKAPPALPAGSGREKEATLETSAEVCSSRQPEIMRISAGMAFLACSKVSDMVEVVDRVDTMIEEKKCCEVPKREILKSVFGDLLKLFENWIACLVLGPTQNRIIWCSARAKNAIWRSF